MREVCRQPFFFMAISFFWTPEPNQTRLIFNLFPFLASPSQKKEEMPDPASKSREASVESIDETCRKVMSSLIPSIDEHISGGGKEGDAPSYDHKTDSLDFLSAKNGLVLSYLIDLVQMVRLVAKGEEVNSRAMKKCLERLGEMKAALDRLRPVEKRMRYQIDRLLAAASGGGASFAARGQDDGSDTEEFHPLAMGADPLSFRPNLGAMGNNDNEEDDDNDGASSDDNGDDDDHLRAARAAASEHPKRKTGQRVDGEEHKEGGDGLYQAPRFAAVPFADREKAEEKAEQDRARRRRRMRQSELLQTLREADGSERPEEDDLGGGAALGKQREAARKIAERDAERKQFEEENMVRLLESRKDKKARGRMMREEQSNLSAIADLGRLAAGVAEAFGDSEDERDTGGFGGDDGGRYSNGRRRRTDDFDDVHGQQNRKKRKGTPRGSNALQRSLYGTEGSKKSKKKSSRR